MNSETRLARKILTFGYGNRKNRDDFLHYLQNHLVKYVIDVRLHPRAWSRQWYGDKLEEFCRENNIKYISKPPLGNTSGKANWIPPDKDKAEAALQEIAELAEDGTVLLLCAEMDYDRCHRLEVAHRLRQLVEAEIVHLK